MNVNTCYAILEAAGRMCRDALLYDPLETAKIMADYNMALGYRIEDGETLSEFNKRVKEMITYSIFRKDLNPAP